MKRVRLIKSYSKGKELFVKKVMKFGTILHNENCTNKSSSKYVLLGALFILIQKLLTLPILSSILLVLDKTTNFVH